MRVQLKRDMHSAKFNITFPKDTDMNRFVYSGIIHVEHPNKKGVLMQVNEKNIKK